MKILLINPSVGPENDYGTLAKAATELPQLGLASLASFLVEAGHTVHIIDKHIMGYSDDQIISRIRTEEYGMVGFSVYVTTRKRALQISRRIKMLFPAVRIIVGGPDPTLDPEAYRQAFIDHIFLGEAEESLLELIIAIQGGNANFPIPGIICRDGDLEQTDLRPRLVSDLEHLPLVKLDHFYDLAKIYPPLHVRGRRLINALFTRGCPYKCRFCAASAVSGRRVRLMSVDRMIRQVEYYLARGYDSISIYDDTFTLIRKRVRQFCQEVVRRKLSFTWNCFTRVDCVDRETLEAMREAGCYLVTFGIESFNNKTLTKLRKGFTADQALEGIRLVRESGIAAQASFMIGLPGEKKEDNDHTIKMAVQSDLDFALFPVFEPYKGTPIYEDCTKEGSWLNIDSDANRLLLDEELIWVPHACSRAEIITLSRRAMREFYFQPRRILFLAKWFAGMPPSRWLRFLSFGVSYLRLTAFNSPESGSTGSRWR